MPVADAFNLFNRQSAQDYDYCGDSGFSATVMSAGGERSRLPFCRSAGLLGEELNGRIDRPRSPSKWDPEAGPKGTRSIRAPPEAPTPGRTVQISQRL